MKTILQIIVGVGVGCFLVVVPMALIEMHLKLNELNQEIEKILKERF